MIRSAWSAENMSTIARALGLVSMVSLTNISSAFAQAPAQGGPSVFEQMIPMVFMLVVMWFLILRPQQKKAKEHQQFLTQLKRGDEVVTSSGILGRVEGLAEKFVTVEIAPDVRIKVLRSQVAGSSAAVTSDKEVKA